MHTKTSGTATRCAVMMAGLLAMGSAFADNWMAQIGGLGAEDVFDLTETSDQRLCATGTFSGTAHFGAADRQVTLRAEVAQDVYVACFSAEGTLDMAVQFGGDISDQPRAIAALPGGDIVITGYFLDTFGAGGSKALTASGGADIFLIRLNSAGEAVWSRRFGGSFADKGNALAITPDGDILLAGNFQNELAYENGGETHEIKSAGERDAFVFRIDSLGNVLWAESFGGSGHDEASRVIAGPGGDVYIAGTFEGTASLADGAGVMSAAHGEDAFLIALDADGQLNWSHQISSANREYVSGLVADERGDLYISGNFLGKLDPPNGVALNSAGGTDIFLMKFDATGKQVWSRRVGGAENEESFDLAVSAGQELMLSGHFQGDIDLPIMGKLIKLKSSGMGNPDGLILTFDSQGQYRQAATAAGDGVETVFTITALQGGGVATAGFFNQEVTLLIDGLSKLVRRGNTDVFVVRVAGSNFRTALDAKDIRINRRPGTLSAR